MRTRELMAMLRRLAVLGGRSVRWLMVFASAPVLALLVGWASVEVARREGEIPVSGLAVLGTVSLVMWAVLVGPFLGAFIPEQSGWRAYVGNLISMAGVALAMPLAPVLVAGTGADLSGPGGAMVAAVAGTFLALVFGPVLWLRGAVMLQLAHAEEALGKVLARRRQGSKRR